MGRMVPWASWDEWALVKSLLLSDSPEGRARGIEMVAAWRARGRVPVGVDATASLLEALDADAASATAGAAAAAAAATWGAGAGAGAAGWQHNGRGHGTLSEQQLRLQYSAAIIRLVNGVADSLQKGKVATSVAALAEAAALPRLLVDVRHAAAHNELPTLAALRLGARHALQWLGSQYWQHQEAHLSACAARLAELLAAVLRSCQAAAEKGLGGTRAAGAEDGDSEGGGSGEDEDGDGAAAGYRAADGQRERRLLLAELRSLVPPAHASALAPVLVDSALTGPGAARDPHSGSGGGSGARDGGGGWVDARQRAALERAACAARAAVLRHYPTLAPAALLEAVGRLCAAAAAPSRPDGGGDSGGNATADAGGGADRAAAWVGVLLQAQVAAAAAAVQRSDRPGKQPKRHQQQHLAAAAVASPSKQAAADAAAADGPRFDAAQLRHLLALLAKAPPPPPSHPHETAAGAAEELAASRLAAVRAISSALGACPGAEGGSASGSGRARPSDIAGRLERLSQLSTPRAPGAGAAAPSGFAGGAAASSGSGGGASRPVDVEAASALQRQLLAKRKRQPPTGPEPQSAVPASEGVRAGRAPPTLQGPALGCWAQVSWWRPCAIGCIPSPILPGGELPQIDLQPEAPGEGLEAQQQQQQQQEDEEEEEEEEKQQQQQQQQPADLGTVAFAQPWPEGDDWFGPTGGTAPWQGTGTPPPEEPPQEPQEVHTPCAEQAQAGGSTSAAGSGDEQEGGEPACSVPRLVVGNLQGLKAAVKPFY